MNSLFLTRSMDLGDTEAVAISLLYFHTSIVRTFSLVGLANVHLRRAARSLKRSLLIY